MIEVNVGPLEPEAPLYQRIARDVSIAVVQTFVDNEFLSSDGKYHPVVRNMVSCVTPKLRDDISEVVGLDFLEKKCMQLIKSIRNSAIIPLDVFNQYLLKVLLQASENRKEISDPPLQEHFNKSLEYFASVHGKGERYDFYAQKMDDLYRFICRPWLSLTDAESNYCGILFKERDFQIFDREDFRTALCLMASSEMQAGTLYFGEDYVARMLHDGGVGAETISNIFSETPFQRSEPVEQELLNTLFDEVMDTVMETASRSNLTDDEISKEIDMRFGGFIRGAMEKKNDTEETISLIHMCQKLQKKQIYFWLVPLKGNEKMLETMPHRKYMDMAITYRHQLPEQTECHYDITYKIMYRYNTMFPEQKLSEEKLYQLALENTKRLFPYQVIPLRDIFSECSDFDELTEHGSGVPLYTLFNEYGDSDYLCSNTSYALVCTELLEALAKELGSEYYIMPFTKQQLMICPAYVPSNVVRVMHECNLRRLDEEEKLTSSLYFYSKRDKALSYLVNISL